MKTISLLLLAASATLSGGCAGNIKRQPAHSASSDQATQTAVADASNIGPSQPEADAEEFYADISVRDPWEKYNRRAHAFNNAVDRFVVRPLAVGYNKVTPRPLRSAVSRFLANLRIPATAINQALQGDAAFAAQSLGRLAVNTTVGIGGLFDPASRFGMAERDNEDFGQTLAAWGWRDSRYLVLPLLGPRTVRDAVAMIGDRPMSPIGQIDDNGVANGLQLLQMLDGRARMLPMDELRKDAFDDYVFVRDAWSQRRAHQINPADVGQ